MKIKDTLITDITDFCQQHGISESRFGMQVARNHKLLKRVRDGVVTASTMEKIYTFMDSHNSKTNTPNTG